MSIAGTNAITELWAKCKAYFQAKLVSGTNIKTINNESLLGSGNISVGGGSSSVTGVKGNSESTYRTGNVNLTAANVGALSLTGGTVNGSVTATGNITADDTIYAQDAHMYIKRASLDTTAANNGISANSYLYHGWIDKNSKFSGWCGNIAYTDGRIATQLAARRVNSSANLDNILVLAVNPDGNRTVTVSDAAPWRTALGLGTAATHNHGDYIASTDSRVGSIESTSGEVCITSLNGLLRLVLTSSNNLRVDTRASTSDEWSNGLYYPGIAPVDVTTIANVITQTSTQSTNNPITAAKYYKVNSVSMVEITFKPAAARSAGTAISLGTIVSGKRPHLQAFGGSDRIMGSITSAGACNLYVRTALTANTAYTIGFTYTT